MNGTFTYNFINYYWFVTFLLLKKERVLGINTDEEKTNNQIKIIESKDYRKNIYDLLNYIPEGILILDKSKK